jgi:hypothetical protein
MPPLTAEEKFAELKRGLDRFTAVFRMIEAAPALYQALVAIRAKVHAHNRGGDLSGKGRSPLRAEIRDICDQALAKVGKLP